MTDNRTLLALVAFPSTLALALFLTSCCCGGDGGADQHDCWASAELGGGASGSRSTNAAKSTAQDRAREGVCISYCQFNDRKVGDAWKKWKKTDSGKKATTRRSWDVDFQKDIKPVYNSCITNCETSRKGGKIKFTEQCYFPAGGKSCTAKINYKKKKVTGKDRGELGAILDACGLYCKEHDKASKKALDKADKVTQAGENWKLLTEVQTCRMDCMHEMIDDKDADVTCK